MDEIVFPVELIKWFSTLPDKKYNKEYEIAERNMKRIQDFLRKPTCVA